MAASNVAIAVIFAVATLFLLVGLIDLRDRWDSRLNKLPLTKRYLRPPGESLRMRLEQLDAKIFDLALWLFALSFVVGYGVYSFLSGSTIGGIAIIGVAVAGMIYWAFHFEGYKKLRRDHYVGFLGERAVGEELNQLMAEGWSVFHDVPFADNPNGKPFNVDHVVVGQGGLFAIETKTRRKRKESGGHKVTFNGQTLEFPWGIEDFGVKKARERAYHLSQWLSKKLQADIRASAVLVLPGWYIDRKGKNDLTVLNEGEIPGLFRDENKTVRLKSEIVASIRALLDERCRDVGA